MYSCKCNLVPVLYRGKIFLKIKKKKEFLKSNRTDLIRKTNKQTGERRTHFTECLDVQGSRPKRMKTWENIRAGGSGSF